MPDQQQPELPVRYSDEEVERILRTAAELQETSSTDLHPAGGLTLLEIQEAAAEAGIAPARVAEAARLLHHAGDSRRIFGAPLRLQYQHSLPGAAPDTVWQAYLTEIRETMEAPGEVSHVPGTLEWTHTDEWETVRVHIASEAAGTRIQVEADRGTAAAQFFTLGGLLGMGAPALLALVLGLGETAVWIAGSGGALAGLAGGGVLWRMKAAELQSRVRTLAARLGRVYTGASPAESTPRVHQ